MTQPITTEPPYDPVDLRPARYTQTVILNDIFGLILDMTTSLQKLAATQADRARLYSTWQKAYTDKMALIHPFIADNGDYIDGDPNDNTADSKQRTKRDELNRLNAAFTQNLQNQQSVVSDDAKALQSSISQSNDAVSQQTNLGTAILQQLSSLLGSIYR